LNFNENPIISSGGSGTSFVQLYPKIDLIVLNWNFRYLGLTLV
jgi:hypothetical protein